ncbi:charged multivesicular body protein 2b-like [Patiria miniata]|uniref:Uncharacterized protein n=1 Tax=Patiria miniata TaxID=46514 RepID=A0A914BSX0_PATMI|nr:charged multivesicular body protein 2b-like [Patiria miniata]
MFRKKPNEKEVMRKVDRDLKNTQRGLERDRAKLEREEQKITLEIKKAAKQGNKQAATVLAKQLVNLRKQKTRMYGASARVSSVNTQAKTMQSNKSMAAAMGNTTKAMGAMNKAMSPEKMMQDMKAFQMESDKMAMKEELMDDTLDAMFEESGDEEEQDAIVSQVLDEIGIEVSGKLTDAPTASHSLPAGQEKTKDAADQEIEAQLARLLKN